MLTESIQTVTHTHLSETLIVLIENREKSAFYLAQSDTRAQTKQPVKRCADDGKHR